MCKGLAAHGAKIAIVGRNLEKAEKVVQEIEAEGGTAKAFQADVSTRSDVERLQMRSNNGQGSFEILIECSR